MVGIDLHDLTVLRTAAATGSFRKAGQCLSMNQSAISRRVHKVEEFLGVSIFERQTTGVCLTHAGRMFVASTSSASHRIETAVRDAKTCATGDAGEIHIAVGVSLSNAATRALLSAFRNAHPEVELYFVRSDWGDLFTRLSHREVDLVIVLGMPPEQYGDRIVLDCQRIHLAIADGDASATEQELSWRDVAEQTFLVGSSDDHVELERHLICQLRKLGYPAKLRRHELTRADMMSLVALGFGVTLAVERQPGAHYPSVSVLPMHGDEETLPISLTWRPENDNPALRRFLSLARVEAKRNGALSAPPQSLDPSP